MDTRTTPTGKTMDAGWEIGVSKTLPHDVETVWKFITGKGLALWLGEGVDTIPTKGEEYRTTDGTSGEGRSLREHDRLRLTWRPTGWTHETTVQVTVSPGSRPGKTVLRFHQERLADARERELQRGFWREAMAKVEKALG